MQTIKGVQDGWLPEGVRSSHHTSGEHCVCDPIGPGTLEIDGKFKFDNVWTHRLITPTEVQLAPFWIRKVLEENE